MVEGMMFYVYATDGKDYQRIPLPELADALRPLLAAQTAPEEVDLHEQAHGLTQRLGTVETERDELAETVARRERQNTTLMRVIEGMADSRDRMAAELAQVRKDSDAKIEMLDAQLDAVTLRSNEAHRNLAALTAMWNAIPWAAMDDIVSTSGVTGSRWQVARGWLDEYRPTTEANS